MAKQKHPFKVEGRTPSQQNFPIDRSMIEMAAKEGGLSADRVPELVKKMEGLYRWNDAERDDAIASDLHLAMAALADALFNAEQRKELMGQHARRLLRETYAAHFGGRTEREDPQISLRRTIRAFMRRHAAMQADLAALSRLARMADIAAGGSKPRGGRPRLLDGVADEVLAIWRTMDSHCLFGRRDDPRPAFYACRLLMQVLFPAEPVDTIERATWEAFNRRPQAKKSGQETPAE
jgi:hypothetical protein